MTMAKSKELNKLLKDYFKSGKASNTNNILAEITEKLRERWTDLVANHSAPSWWGRMAILKGSGGGGGFLIKQRAPGSYRIMYANEGRYNYLAVIQNGRARFDMKPGLLNSSKARHGKNGRYLIIPFSKNEDGSNVSPKNNTISKVLTKTGSKKEPSIKDSTSKVVRNKYKSRVDPGMSGTGNVSASEQVYKNGHVHRSSTKFVILSDKSKGFFYPKINAQQFDKSIEKLRDQALKSETLKKAVAIDSVICMKEHLFKKKF
jgi:hypothetical protein